MMSPPDIFYFMFWMIDLCLFVLKGACHETAAPAKKL